MRALRPTLIFLALVMALAVTGPSAPSPAGAQDPPEHAVTVSGDGASTYPAFDETISRYGIRTTPATAGTVTVTASTTDPAGTVTVNGRPVANGAALDLTGLSVGDEIAVRIVDGRGTTTYGLIYLPADFPLLEATSTGSGPADGEVFLGLIRFFPGPAFQVVVDDNGVPRFVAEGAVNDFKRQPDGRYTVARTTTVPGRTGERIHALDATFQETDVYDTVGLVNTDFHDSILLPGGGRILIAYEVLRPDVIDAVIQEVDANGDVVFEWQSDDHIPLTDAVVNAVGDYAHINSVAVTRFAGSTQRLANGNTLIGWAGSDPVATEVDGAGDEVWSLRSSLGYLTYRAFRFPAPDAIAPLADLAAPADGAVFERDDQVIADYGCTDRGGSTLQGCTGPVGSGQAVDTSMPGEHEFTVTAVDGDGNTTAMTHGFTVTAPRPDARIRQGLTGPTVGDDRYNTTGAGQTRTVRANRGTRLTFFATVQNDDLDPDRFRLHGQPSTPNYTVRYLAGGADVTGAVRTGWYQTPVLAQGEVRTLKVVVDVGAGAPAGSRVERLVTATSTTEPSTSDVVRVIVERR